MDRCHVAGTPLFANADTIMMVQRLQHDAPLRTAAAEAIARNRPDKPTPEGAALMLSQ